MTDDKKAVPVPGEAERDDEDVRYFEVDETNVSGATESQRPHGHDVTDIEPDEQRDSGARDT